MTSSFHHWAIVAPFFRSATDQWICHFIEDTDLTFSVVAHRGEEVSWHLKKRARTGGAEWLNHARTAHEGLKDAHDHDGGLITVFPQLAATAGIIRQARFRSVPIVAWFFNTTFHTDRQRQIGRMSLRGVDRFVVHSTREISAYSVDLGFPEDRFCFVPYQYGGDVQSDLENTDEPFLFATGSGFRDYATMFKAVEKLGYPTKIVAGERILRGIPVPSNVEIIEGLHRADIHSMVRQARVNVLPMTTEGLTAGIVTIAETFRHERALVSTERPGLEDYLLDSENSLLAPPGDVDAMAERIEALWSDATLRDRLNQGAAKFGKENCSDEAAAANLASVLRSI